MEFPPGLDELFGVSNNKQSASNFTELAKVNFKDFLEDGKTIVQLKSEMFEESDPRAVLLDLVGEIQKRISSMRALQKERKVKTRLRHPDEDSVVDKASIATQKRIDEGFTGTSDKQQETLSGPAHEADLQKSLVETGVEKKSADKLAAKIVGSNLKYLFQENGLESPAFFSVKMSGGAIIVTLNTSHPVYTNLVEVLEQDITDQSQDELKERLSNSLKALKLLLTAWARCEDEQPDGTAKHRAQEARNDWGKICRQFFEPND